MHKLSENKLDNIIKDEYKTRFNAYNRMQWYIGVVDVSEIAMWRGAGGVPRLWTKKSLHETSRRIQQELAKKRSRFRRVRAIKVIPKIAKLKNIIKKEKYLYPIILPNGEIPSARKGMNKVDYFLDDGNMRALAFAISGDKKIKTYIGFRKNKI